MQRHQVRAPAVAMSFDQPDFSAAHRSVNLDARDTEVSVADSRGKVIERLEKMNIGIPERIVGVENEIQRLGRRTQHLYTEYRRARRRGRVDHLFNVKAGVTPAPSIKKDAGLVGIRKSFSWQARQAER